MNDRLRDLCGSDTSSWADEDSESQAAQDTTAGSNQLELKSKKKKKRKRRKIIKLVSHQKERGSHMEAFFRDVALVKANIVAIQEATAMIRDLNDGASIAVTEAAEAEVSMKLRPLVDATNKDAKRTKDILASMKDVNSELAKEGGEKKQSDLQMRENLCYTLSRKFVDELKLYQAAQEKYKADMKRRARRQILVIQPDATDEEIDMVMKSEGGREGLYQHAILKGGPVASKSIISTYSMVADKYRDIRIIEQSVSELHQMFLDLAFLTEQQGEHLDHIEQQVEKSADYAGEGTIEIHKALLLAKKIRKKHCFIILVVIVVAVVITVLMLL